MTPATRWALACGVVVFAVLLALLPRATEQGAGEHEAAPDDAAATAELEAAREEASLRPCPAGSEQTDDGPDEVEDLHNVETLCLEDGRVLDLGEALAGSATLINVWATWCAPCLEELPVLEEYAARDGAVDVLGVQVESDPAEGLEMLADLGVGFPSVHDGGASSGPVREALSVPAALPASYLVNEHGEVSFITDPRVFGSADDVAEAVNEFGGSG